jgi:DNA-binding transcriptional ArsR family regulator
MVTHQAREETHKETKNDTKRDIHVVKLSGAGKLAKTLSNETSQKILEYMRLHKETTASTLSKALSLAPSTVHYNLQALTKAGVITSDSFHYSEKGREVVHYTLTNKIIVILPEEETSLWSQLKVLLPGLLAVSSIALFGIIRLLFEKTNMFSSIRPASTKVVEHSDALVSSLALEESSLDLAQATTQVFSSETTVQLAQSSSSLDVSSLIIGLLIGMGFLVVVTIVYFFIKRTTKK